VTETVVEEAITCCHPALSADTRIALTLRMVGGRTVPEIARAFLVQEVVEVRHDPPCLDHGVGHLGPSRDERLEVAARGGVHRPYERWPVGSR
jgi:hypothetical protein